MPMHDWIYVAPHRIRGSKLAFHKCCTWKEYEALNMQRLARVFEFQSGVAFVGSGASRCLKYPGWKQLLPSIPGDAMVAELAYLLEKGKVDLQQAIQLIEEAGNKDRQIVRDWLRVHFFVDESPSETEARLQLVAGNSPFPALLHLSIRRFVTTNYDEEIEKELTIKFGPDAWSWEKSFEQDDQQKLSIFAVALASENRNMVFHCHGKLSDAVKRPDAGSRESTRHRRMILTDADYNHWYLSKEPGVYTLQRCLDITLQSNPIFFIGYSLSDADILRILRRASLRWASQRMASNLFLLQDLDDDLEGFSDKAADAWCLAKQIKFGVNLLTYHRDGKDDALAKELKKCKKDCSGLRKRWRLQPQVKPRARGPAGVIGSRYSKSDKVDCLFDPAELSKDSVLGRIAAAFEGNFAVALIGPAGTGKLLKACQFVNANGSRYHAMVFHAYNNDDVYSYLQRIAQAVFGETFTKRRNFLKRFNACFPGNKCALVVINNIDLLLEIESSDKWTPRNRAAKRFFDKLLRWSVLADRRVEKKKNTPGLKVLLTARHLPTPAVLETELLFKKENSSKSRLKSAQYDSLLRNAVALGAEDSFSAGQCGLHPAEFHSLLWELRLEHSALILAANFLTEQYPDQGDPRQDALDRVLEALRSNSSEKETRVVRHILRELDALEKHGPRGYETLLAFLSCFNTPFAENIFEETAQCCMRYLADLSEKKSLNTRPVEFVIDAPDQVSTLDCLRRLGLVQAIVADRPEDFEDEKEGGEKTGDKVGEHNYVVHPLVKRYFRQVLERSQTYPEMEEFGLHGLLSKGPFNSPGKARKAKKLFEHFAELAYNDISELLGISLEARAAKERTRFYIRALIDLLRGNFACNRVPSWGHFRDYIDMLSITIDLLRNLALATGTDWEPGKQQEETAEDMVASAEEMLYLYNELGLAYYNTGSVQDALSVWGLAFDWQKVLAKIEPEQAQMYAASLHSHLGMGYLQLGRMTTATECFQKGLAEARATGNPDLEWRMKGMLGRIDHFRGSTKVARATYKRVINGLGEVGNKRAQSYFMRHLSALELRQGDTETARKLAQESRTIAASENAIDLVAFSLEMEARVHDADGKIEDAIRTYRIALEEARKLDISRLQADVLLGIANIQLRLGDAGAARRAAIEVMEIANENLLVLRQIKALIVLGKAAAEVGDGSLAKHTLKHAIKLAADSQFLLVEHDAKTAISELRVGGSGSNSHAPPEDT